MAYQMASLKLEMKEVVHVKPSKPTPSIVLHLSTLDHRPYPDSIWPIVHVYRSASNGQLDPALVLKQALSKALFYYYPLAGKLVKQPSGKVAINCNNDGVPFLEAIANCELSSLNYLDDHDIRIAKQLVYDFHPQDENEYPHPVAFKVTKFQCGGFTIGMSTSHIVCDGWGACQFFHAIVELASGKSEPYVKPVWERERLMGSITTQPMLNPMDHATAAVSPFLPATDVMYELFKVGSESIRRLKMSLMKEISGNESMENGFTTFESLAAYVWRSRARALKLNNEGKTLLVFSVQVRQHLSPPLSDGYYGTAITEGQVVLTMRELNEKPLSDIVKLVKESKNVAFTGDFIKNTIDTLETNPENFNVEEGPGATLALSDWKHLGFLPNVDFGWKEPINMVPAPCNMFEYEGLCIFLPPSNYDPSMEGGVRIFISLPSVAMPMFREEIEALKLTAP